MVYWLKKIRNLLLVKVIWRKYTIGSGFHTGARVRLWARNKLIICKNFYIGRDSFIETDCVIGDDVILGNRVGIVGAYDHNYQQVGVSVRMADSIRDKSYDWKGKDKVTNIGNDVWIGYGAIIMGGVTIADGSIIGAGSIVTKNTEPYCIYVGCPAIKLKTRFETMEQLEEHKKLLIKNKSR